MSEDQGQAKNNEGRRAELFGNLSRFKLWKKMWRDYENGVGQVADCVVEETLKHLSLKKLESPTPLDSLPGSLLLHHLGSSWEALPVMQTEFRRWFGRYLPSKDLDELEQHERSIFKHLWAISYNFIHEPLRTFSGGAAYLERNIKEKRREFLLHLNEQLTAVMSGAGTVQVGEGPYSIDGNRCLLVACDHQSLETMESLRPEVVITIWRAAHASSWRDMEWTPIWIEWPSIFVTHILRGRGLYPGGTKLSSFTLFATLFDFEVQNHHLMELPVSSTDYKMLGLSLWDTPMLTAWLQFQGLFFAFIISLSRFHSLAQLATEHGLSDTALEPCLKAFSQEVSTLRLNALVAYEDLDSVMRIHPEMQASAGKESRERLDRLCKDVLFLGDTQLSMTITPDIFADWIGCAGDSMEEAMALSQVILRLSVSSAAVAL